MLDWTELWSRRANQLVETPMTDDMIDMRTQVVVVGTGPGGEGAAMKAVKEGKQVMVVERHAEVGGGCTHWGTIPSKALRQIVQRRIELQSCAGMMSTRHLTFPSCCTTSWGYPARRAAVSTTQLR